MAGLSPALRLWPASLSPSWPGVSRPPTPSRWDRRGGCTTAGARVAGTRPAMTIQTGNPSPAATYPDAITAPGHSDMAPPVHQSSQRLVSEQGKRPRVLRRGEVFAQRLGEDRVVRGGAGEQRHRRAEFLIVRRTENLVRGPAAYRVDQSRHLPQAWAEHRMG